MRLSLSFGSRLESVSSPPVPFRSRRADRIVQQFFDLLDRSRNIHLGRFQRIVPRNRPDRRAPQSPRHDSTMPGSPIDSIWNEAKMQSMAKPSLARKSWGMSFDGRARKARRIASGSTRNAASTSESPTNTEAARPSASTQQKTDQSPPVPQLRGQLDPSASSATPRECDPGTRRTDASSSTSTASGDSASGKPAATPHRRISSATAIHP